VSKSPLSFLERVRVLKGFRGRTYHRPKEPRKRKKKVIKEAGPRVYDFRGKEKKKKKNTEFSYVPEFYKKD